MGRELAEARQVLETWKAVEEANKEPSPYAIHFFELNMLPSRSFPIHHAQPVSEADRATLRHLRSSQEDVELYELDDDERMGELSKPWDRFRDPAGGRQWMFTNGLDDPSSPGWGTCFEMCEKGKPRKEGDNRDEAHMEAWDALKSYRVVPSDDEAGETTYIDLFNDKESSNIKHRGMMLNLSLNDLQLYEARGCSKGSL